MSNSDPTDFTNYLPAPLRFQARAALAARRVKPTDPTDGSYAAVPEGDTDATLGTTSVCPANFDPPTDAQFQTLDVADAIGRCIDQVGWDRFRILVTLVASARGER